MPNVVYNGVTHEYAEESELLEFANKVRVAGGGNPIEGFFPSEPSNPNTCLIANALNFGCSVDVGAGELWEMDLTESELSYDEVVALGEAIDCEVVGDDSYYGLVLPPRIGYAALAFDHADEGWVVAYRKTI